MPRTKAHAVVHYVGSWEPYLIETTSIAAINGSSGTPLPKDERCWTCGEKRAVVGLIRSDGGALMGVYCPGCVAAAVTYNIGEV